MGFRPFVYRLAKSCGLAGHVENNPRGVLVEIEGQVEKIDMFIMSLRDDPPPLAMISDIYVEEIPPVGDSDFRITTSDNKGDRVVWISPDTCVCEDCLAELLNPADRRYLYPFINCTNCGPRYTIITDIPYDRPNTTMTSFKMCADCQREYDNPLDRRFHAQPNACPRCGPKVSLVDARGGVIADESDAFRDLARTLYDGGIAAVKGLGGFHLAVDARNESAVKTLRERKQREEKPLAVMVCDMAEAESLVIMDNSARELLQSPARPIVLLNKAAPEKLAPSIAPASKSYGIMLPYAPLHFVLFQREFNAPRALVMTSGNISDEPIVSDKQRAFDELGGIADVFLVHDRDIFIQTDDSVATVIAGNGVVTRRSRGYAPTPIQTDHLKGQRQGEILAVGPELKNTVCLTRGDTAVISQHIGDLKNIETFHAFERTVEHVQKIFQVTPSIIARDMHPLYMSSRYAEERTELEGLKLIDIQHHHAHIVSCLVDAEHRGDSPVIGLAFDGTGYGADGAVWGCEFMLADRARYRRMAHLEYLPLPGGDAVIEQPWRMALACLHRSFGSINAVQNRMDKIKAHRLKGMGWLSDKRITPVMNMIEKNLNSPSASSMGRLFDAISALIGVCDHAAYEGQPAIELEAAVEYGVEGVYPFSIYKSPNGILNVSVAETISAIVEDLCSEASKGVIAARFHNTVVEFSLSICRTLRDKLRVNTIALSGGCFQNRILTEGLLDKLGKAGFQVLTHRRVPPNDGGVALGQAVVAAAMIEETERNQRSPRSLSSR